MKRLAILGLAGVVSVGLAGLAVVASLTQQVDRPPDGTGAAPVSAGEVAAPPAPPAFPSSTPGVPRYLALPAGAVERDLAAAAQPCHGRFRMGSGPPTVLTLELEAEDGGGLGVVGSRVASAGSASEGLVSCLRELLPGHRVAAGSFPAGERFLVEYKVEQEVVADSKVAPPASPVSPAPTSTTRQPPSRRAGSR